MENRKKFLILLIITLLLIIISVLLVIYTNFVNSANEEKMVNGTSNLQKNNESVNKNYESTVPSSDSSSSTSTTIKTVLNTYKGSYEGTVIKLYNDGTATVIITNARLWSDVAEPNSTEEKNRQQTILNIQNKERAIVLNKKIEEIYPTKITSYVSATAEYAVIKSIDKKYYLVDLISLKTNGESPQPIQELPEIDGKNIVSIGYDSSIDKLLATDAARNMIEVNIVK